MYLLFLLVAISVSSLVGALRSTEVPPEKDLTDAFEEEDFRRAVDL